MRELTGRAATSADIPALQAFTCTTAAQPRPPAPPALRRRFSRWWEYNAQALIRDLRPPPRQHGEHIVVWHHGEVLAAVCQFVHVDPAAFWVGALAVADPLRGRGLGRQVAADLETRIADLAAAAGAGEVTITTRVHQDNAASRGLCARLGLEPVSTTTFDDDSGVWMDYGITLELDEPR